MKYVDWVERVLERLARGAIQGEGYAGGGEVFLHGLGGEIGAEGDEGSEAVWQAVDDLAMLGLAERPDNLSVRLTQLGRRVAAVGIRQTWPEIGQMWLDAEQAQFLAKAVEMGERRTDGFAQMEMVDSAAVFEALGWPDATQREYGFTQPLEDTRFIAKRIATNAYVKVRPTYLGVVRVTEAEGIEGQQLLEKALGEGETTNVEIKQRLDLTTEDGKAKFVRHTLALATTKTSGRRFLIVGFDDRTREFFESPDPKITQERLEQVLHAYTDPTPTSRFRRIPVKEGEVVLFELLREPHKLPYRVTKDLGPLRAGDVYARHGSASEKPTDRELGDLEAEGADARGVVSQKGGS